MWVERYEFFKRNNRTNRCSGNDETWIIRQSVTFNNFRTALMPSVNEKPTKNKSIIVIKFE